MERIQYAICAAAFLMARLAPHKFKKIKSVILFGSVAANTAEEESDVDLFFDIDTNIKETREIKKEINRAVADFYLSAEALKFKLAGIDNEISVQVGKIDRWKDLQASIESNGIVLYGRYIPSKKIPKRYTVFYWEKPGKRFRGAFLNKIYGYKVHGKRYTGLAEKLGGRRIGKSAVIIPSHKKNEFMKVLEKYRVDYNIVEL